MITGKLFLITGSVFALLAVVLGAFAAHGLQHTVDAKSLTVFHTAVEYQFYHSFALLLTGLFSHLFKPSKLLKSAGLFFIGGTLIFSGSLYAYVLTSNKVFGMITPIGGLSFIIGWILLTLFFIRSK